MIRQYLYSSSLENIYVALTDPFILFKTSIFRGMPYFLARNQIRHKTRGPCYEVRLEIGYLGPIPLIFNTISLPEYRCQAGASTGELLLLSELFLIHYPATDLTF
jgi:hypothetical protein